MPPHRGLHSALSMCTVRFLQCLAEIRSQPSVLWQQWLVLSILRASESHAMAIFYPRLAAFGPYGRSGPRDSRCGSFWLPISSHRPCKISSPRAETLAHPIASHPAPPQSPLVAYGGAAPPPCLPAFSFFHATSPTPNPQPRAALPPWTSTGQQEQRTAAGNQEGLLELRP
jgi:hypothetical protein